MKQKLPILIVISLLTFSLTFSVKAAQDSNLQISDFALDIQEGEKGTTNDVDAQNNQQEVSDNEEAQAAADDGNPDTGLVQAALDEAVAPEEAQESAKLVENSQATSSENDNGEVLKDQSSASSDEELKKDVNIQDQNAAPAVDADTLTQEPAEQPLDQVKEPAADNQANPSEGATGENQ